MNKPIKLPPFPQCYKDRPWMYEGGLFTEGQIRAYACAAIEADRQENKITGETSDGRHTFNELYAHRVRLFCLLMYTNKGKAWWSRKHHDGSAWEGWVIAGIDTPEGSATYHLPESEIENLPEGTELPNGKEWDGHTSDDVLVRLLSLRQASGEPVNVHGDEEIEELAKIPEDFFTHKLSWRNALETLASLSNLSEDDRLYWSHELNAFDKAYEELQGK